MNVAYLILGGNLGDRIKNISLAENLLHKSGIKISSSSAVYQTAPWRMQNCPDFYNKVLKVETLFNPEALLKVCLDVEVDFGRIRRADAYLSREMDVDILFYENLILNTPLLSLPHPKLHLRKFVLIPLNEISPDLIHPVFNKSIRQLLSQCEDNLRVTKVE
ncbi:MAG: 2-amino-4-hydroxy-6-hydroxymethyldihydropteridine diphosphokinase [Bacteroidota bacterium]|jgi:2-amino-4-hydroxy-6-hydroxymethyldihydropteridine diphosphokinase